MNENILLCEGSRLDPGLSVKKLKVLENTFHTVSIGIINPTAIVKLGKITHSESLVLCLFNFGFNKFLLFIFP